jgi:hypothetical protein
MWGAKIPILEKFNFGHRDEKCCLRGLKWMCLSVYKVSCLVWAMVCSTTERERMECCDKCQDIVSMSLQYSMCCDKMSGYCQYVTAAFHVLWQVSGYCQYVAAVFHVLWQSVRILSVCHCSIPCSVTSVRILSVCHCSIPSSVTSVRILSVCHCGVPCRRHVTKNRNYNVDIIKWINSLTQQILYKV